MCRCCFKNHFSKEDSKKHGHIGRILLIGLFLLSAGCMSLSYFGYGKLVTGMDSLSEVIDKLSNSFGTMEKASVGLYNQKGETTEDLPTMVAADKIYDGYQPSIMLSTCTQITGVSFDSFYTGTESLKDLLDGLGDKLTKFSEDLQGPYKSVLGYFLSGLTAFYWFLALLGAFATYTEHIRCDDRLFVLLASLAMVIFIVFLGACIMASVLIADFCYGPGGEGPGESLVSAAPESSAALAKYYVTCSGTNELMDTMKTISSALVALNDVTTSTEMATLTTPNQLFPYGFCNANGVDGLSQETEESVGYFNDILGEMQCATITPLLETAMHDTLCVETLDGLTMTWVSMCIASFFLWLSMVFFPCVTHHINQSKGSAKIGIMEAAAEEAASEKDMEAPAPLEIERVSETEAGDAGAASAEAAPPSTDGTAPDKPAEEAAAPASDATAAAPSEGAAPAPPAGDEANSDEELELP